MAFLDNSGDIILDAVLTDHGRKRLAQGDGSFRIAKFALGDDEIDYSLYNSNDSRGSAYFDLDILSTPVLEAFTDNFSALKSKLMSIPRNDLLYLPVIKLSKNGLSEQTTLGVYCVASDEITEKMFSGPSAIGVFGSTRPGSFSSEISLHQGLDTTEISFSNVIDSDLKETQYIVEVDNRLTKVLKPTDNSEASVSYIDDDNIASYYFTYSTDSDMVRDINNTNDSGGTGKTIEIAGPRGTKLSLKIKSTMDLQYSTFLFERLGSVKTLNINNTGNTQYHTIDSNIRVMGATTGYKIDIPIRFLKKV